MILCLIRKVLVAKTPEEEVRQRLLLYLIHKKGFPEELIAVEKSLATLPHLEKKPDLPDRRADLIVYSSTSPFLSPLFLIECKAGPFQKSIFRQIIGYNHFVKAPWIAIANGTSIQSGRFIPSQGWVFGEGILSYAEAKDEIYLGQAYTQRA